MSPISFLEFGTFSQVFGAMQGAAFPFATAWDVAVEENPIVSDCEELKVYPDSCRRSFDPDELLRKLVYVPCGSETLPPEYGIFSAKPCKFHYPLLPEEDKLPEGIGEKMSPPDEAISPSASDKTDERFTQLPKPSLEEKINFWGPILSGVFHQMVSEGIRDGFVRLKRSLETFFGKVKTGGEE